MISKNQTPLLRVILYIVVIVLINIAGSTLFFRIDLTEDNVYSLSGLSKSIVKQLEEPLTIKAFFSEELPQPYNTLEQEVRDLLEEYGLSANRYFNYAVHTISNETEGQDELKEMAENYSIYPVQIQNVEQDEVKLQKAYMGMAFIHGDMIETISVLESSDNLEYKITTTLQKMIDKTSALLSLETPIDVRLYLSSELYNLGNDLKQYPDTVKSITRELNKELYDTLTYSYVDPSAMDDPGMLKDEYDLAPLILKKGRGQDAEEIETFAHVVIEHDDNRQNISILEQHIFGYQLVDQESIKERISNAVDKMIGINTRVGYITSHGSPALWSNPAMQGQAAPSLNTFRALASDTYAFKTIDLKQDPIPEDIETLVIAGPTQSFSDWELYQIDQFLMNGNSVAFFIDTHQEVQPQRQNQFYGQPPQYIPLNTGLRKLLETYGVTIKNSYVLDEECFVQRSRQRSGGMQEVSIYNAPMLKGESINNSLPFMKNIKGLVVLNASPVSVAEETDADVTTLLTSSDKAWEMAERINLYNPMMISPPSEEQRSRFTLSVLAEGDFESYFRNKDIPKPDRKDEEGEAEQDEAAVIIKAEEAEKEIPFSPATDRGKVFIIGTSTLLQDNLLDPEGGSPNSMFVMNILDYLSDRQDYAVMRSKGRLYNPLDEVPVGTKTFIKTFNIAGLPILVILAGIVVWIRWMSRKKRIQMMFSMTKENEQ